MEKSSDSCRISDLISHADVTLSKTLNFTFPLRHCETGNNAIHRLQRKYIQQLWEMLCKCEWGKCDFVEVLSARLEGRCVEMSSNLFVKPLGSECQIPWMEDSSCRKENCKFSLDTWFHFYGHDFYFHRELFFVTIFSCLLITVFKHIMLVFGHVACLLGDKKNKKIKKIV